MDSKFWLIFIFIRMIFKNKFCYKISNQQQDSFLELEPLYLIAILFDTVLLFILVTFSCFFSNY